MAGIIIRIGWVAGISIIGFTYSVIDGLLCLVLALGYVRTETIKQKG